MTNSPAAALSRSRRLQPYLQHLQTLRERTLAARRNAPDALRRLWNEQRIWLWVIIPVLLMGIRSAQWADASWRSVDYALLWQPFTPLFVMLLVWTRRYELVELSQEMDFLFPGDSPKRRGKPWVLIVGCLVLISAFLTTASTFAYFGLLIIVVGAIYYVYGPLITRALWQPLLLLLMTLPLPGILVRTLSASLQIGGAVVTSQLLQASIPTVRAQFGAIVLPHYQLVVTSGLGGLNILLPCMVLLLWYSLLRRVPSVTAVLQIASAAIIGLALNIFRLLILAMIANGNISLGDELTDPVAVSIQTIFLIVATLGLNVLLWRLATRSRRGRISQFEADLREAHRLAQEQAAALSQENR